MHCHCHFHFTAIATATGDDDDIGGGLVAVDHGDIGGGGGVAGNDGDISCCGVAGDDGGTGGDGEAGDHGYIGRGVVLSKTQWCGMLLVPFSQRSPGVPVHRPSQALLDCCPLPLSVLSVSPLNPPRTPKTSGGSSTRWSKL